MLPATAFKVKVFALLLALTGLGLGIGHAGEKIRVELYLGENTPPAPHVTVAPDKLAKSLQTVFGFKHYELVKAHDIELAHDWQQWAVPRKDLFIRVQPLPAQSGKPQVVDFEVYKDSKIVAHGKYEPSQGTSLFINGPDFKKGRLIFVLEAK